MKNLRIAMIALILTTIVHSCSGQTSVSLDPVTGLVAAQMVSMSPYIHITGRVFNSEMKKIGISLYILGDDCSWTMLEMRQDNDYSFLLERDQEYQVWFHDKNAVKILYIDPGYTGEYVYDIDVNFNSPDCVRMTPVDNGPMDIYLMSFAAMTPLIYQQGVILD